MDSHSQTATDITARARRIKLLLMDCDGVLTDGRLWLTSDGDEQKAFHARDGQGISLLHRAGLQTGIITGRTSSAVDRRAQDLKMSYVRQYAKDKIKALEEILAEAGATTDECAYIGDDVGDIPVMRRVGLASQSQTPWKKPNKPRITSRRSKEGRGQCARSAISFSRLRAAGTN
jgi:3-deoxy-D-manno-octulosonate 8-phosphate phosphatase (KDO 8-P phosphatase)